MTRQRTKFAIRNQAKKRAAAAVPDPASWQFLFLRAVAKGASTTRAARDAGVSRTTAYNYGYDDYEYDTYWREARHVAAAIRREAERRLKAPMRQVGRGRLVPRTDGSASAVPSVPAVRPASVANLLCPNGLPQYRNASSSKPPVSTLNFVKEGDVWVKDRLLARDWAKGLGKRS